MNPLRRGRRLVTICIVAGLFGLTREASQAQTQAAIDLTGLWAADNGTTFYVRQIGSTVWWAGFDPDPFSPVAAKSMSFHRGLNTTQVFQGVLSGSTVTGDWTEVPRQNAFNLQQGTLSLQVVQGASPSDTSLHLLAQTGGFNAHSWTRTTIPAVPCTDQTGRRSPYCLFGKVLKNQTETFWGSHQGLLDNLKPYKDNAVIFATVTDPYTLPGALSCAEFFANNAGDDDLNVQLLVDRANLDSQPGFWTDGWVNNATDVQGKLNGSHNAMHSETIAYGRQDAQCAATSPVFLPGWGEAGANGSLWQGVPISSPPAARLPMRLGSRVRILGVIALDCGHGITSPCSETDPLTNNLEIHPVYSVDVLQDYTTPRPQNVDLTGTWAASDVGTYYVRQSGGTIWWLGLSRDQGLTFANVFRGTMTRGLPIVLEQKAPDRALPPSPIPKPPLPEVTVISGQWASLPLGSQQADGTLTLSGTFCKSSSDSSVPCDASQPSSSWNSLLTETSSSPVFSNPPNQQFQWQKLYDRNGDPTPRIVVPAGALVGKVANGMEFTRSFPISNAGTAPLVVTIKGSILAMEVSPPTLTLPPGGGANVSIRWLVANDPRPGSQTEEAFVKLTTNDPSALIVAVPVQVTVRGGQPQ